MTIFLHADSDGNISFKNPIIVSLIVAFVILLGVFFLSVFWSHEKQSELARESFQKSVEDTFPALWLDEANAMESILGSIVRIEVLKTRFLARDRQDLLAESSSLFQNLHDQYRITHFYFTAPDRVNFLRVHQPKRFGDEIGR